MKETAPPLEPASVSDPASVADPAPAPAEFADPTRFMSILSALLFIPAALLCGVLTLTTERAGRCVTYGEGCGPSLPGWLFAWSLGVGAVACLVALVASEARTRRISLAVQLLSEGTALVVILSHA